MFYLVCTDLELCGRMSKVESEYSSALTQCPHCTANAVLFPNKLSAMKAASRSNTNKDINVRILAQIIKKLNEVK
tara:strand:- start:21996 stop:22220 length:225 start_codon:yes stop_codon:yes gene_type:complete